MKYKKYIITTFLILCVCSAIIFLLIKNRINYDHTNTSTHTISSIDTYKYYVKFQNDRIVVFNRDDSVFEFTDLNKDLLPVSLIYELETGKHFKNEQELYEFLETYTS